MAITAKGAFADALHREIAQANRDFWVENTAMLLAYGRGEGFPFPTDEEWATARERVGKLTDEQLSEAAHAVGEADRHRCSECGRDYDND